MGCSFGSSAGAAVIRFRSLYAPQNLKLELLKKPRSVTVLLLSSIMPQVSCTRPDPRCLTERRWLRGPAIPSSALLSQGSTGDGVRRMN